MNDLPSCPVCHCENTYEESNLIICPECGHEWSLEIVMDTESESNIVKDAHGSVLSEGDNVTIVKDLKVKGSSSVLKVGTKVKIIRFIEGDHNIDCKVDGIGAMKLKSEFVKKAG